MKKVLSIFIVNILCLTVLMAQENVSDVRVELRDTLLNVTYNLQKDSKVEIYYSSSEGSRYIGPLKEITGDYGDEVKAGEYRVIVWNPVEEVGYIEAPNSVIKIVADAIPEPEPEPEPVAKKDWGKHNLLMVGASLVNGDIADMPISLMYGRYRHFGFYGKLEINTSIFSFSERSTRNTTSLILDDEIRYIWLGGKVGFLWNLNNHFLINLGVGVQQNFLYLKVNDQTVAENFDGYIADYIGIQEPIGSSYFFNGDQLSLVGEIGVTYNWRKLSVGVNVTPNFNRFVGYEGMGAEEYSQSYYGGEYDDYEEWATPIYKTKFITSVMLGINF